MKMVKQEFLNILKNKVLLISVIAITFIPILYAGFFSKSVWDPYGRAKNLPVAVVNEDVPVEMMGQKVNVGDQVVANLKSNHDLKWEFVSAEKAKKGMEDLHYYMIVTIPKDFSKDATTLLDKNPKKMELTYTTNGSLNYIGEEISQIGATTLEAQVRESVTESYVEALNEVGKEAAKGMDQASDGAKQLASGTVQLENGLVQYTEGVSQAADGSNQLAAGTNQLASNIGPLSSGVGQLDTGAATLSSALNTVDAKVQPLDSKVAALSAGLNELSRGSKELEQALQNVESSLDPTSKATIQQNLDQAKVELDKIMTDSKILEQTSIETGQISTELEHVSNQLAELNTKLAVDSSSLQSQIAASINQHEELEAAAKNQLIAEINGQIAAFETAQNAKIQSETAVLTADIQKASAAVEEFAIQTKAFSELVAGISANTGKLNNGLTEIETGTNNLLALADLPPLRLNATAIVNNLDQASTDLTLLSAELPTALSGVDQLAAGGNQLSDGLNQLSAQMPALSDGVTQLNSGADQLNSGLLELTDNSPQLTSGASQLEDGSGQLASALGEAAAMAGKANLGEKNIEMFAAPTDLELKEYSHVSNYGEALSPYIMSLALFVGCLVFNFVFPIRKVSLLGQSARDWWFSKVSIGFAVSSAMAAIEATVMLLIGLHVDNIGQFYLMSFISAWAYMFIVMFLAMTFDNPGRFIAMILLVLQLGGAGGTFPMPLTNGFFNAIHPYLPMSYSIYGFREAISGGIGAPMFHKSALILSILFVVFVLLLGSSMKWLHKHQLSGKSQLDNNQELLALEKQA